MEQIKDTTATSSVIIPLYNGRRHISSLLDSLSNQKTEYPFEILVSDNASTDDSAQIVNEFIGENLNCRIIDSSSKRGKNFSLNNAVRQASSGKLIFVDQDDELAINYVQEMSLALDEFQIVAASMDSIKLNRSLIVPQRFAPRNQKIGEFAIKVAAGGSLGVTKDIFEKLGGFDEDFEYSTGDVDFCCRAHDAGYDLHLVEDTVLYYRFRETVIDNLRQGIFYGRGNRAIEERFPGIRGIHRTKGQIGSSIIKDSIKLTNLFRQDRQKVAHNLGKNLGYLLEDGGR
jgi:glycosyltransferase involved in cell wall biosynthesis